MHDIRIGPILLPKRIQEHHENKTMPPTKLAIACIWNVSLQIFTF